MNEISETKQLLAMKFGAMLTLDQVAPYFGCSTGKSITAMYNKGQFPVPITTLKRKNAKTPSKGVAVGHLADYLDSMIAKGEKVFNQDVAAFNS